MTKTVVATPTSECVGIKQWNRITKVRTARKPRQLERNFACKGDEMFGNRKSYV